MTRLSRLEIKSEKRKQYIIKRYLASLVITSIVLVASFRLFLPIKAEITNISVNETTLTIKTFVVPSDTLVQGSLIISLESTSTKQEIPILIGESTAYFTDFVYGRTYKIKIKGDTGYGLQTFHEETYQIKKRIFLDMNINQYGNSLNYYIHGYDGFDIIKDNSYAVDIYEGSTLIRTDMFEIDVTNNMQAYGSIDEIATNGIKYTFIIKYADSGGNTTILEKTFMTNSNPTVDGEVYGDMKSINYFFYINDFEQKLKSKEVKVVIKSKNYSEERLYDLTQSEGIQDRIDQIEVGYYEINVYLDLGKGFTSFYKSYIEIGE